jgi:hypothetical protein
MPIQKGHTNNPSGRSVGSKNKRTKEWEALGESIVNEHTERFNRLLAEIKDDAFLDKYIQILEYFKPKLARTTLEGGEKPIEISTTIKWGNKEVKV